MRLIAAVFLVMIFAGCTTTGQSERPPGPMPATTRPVYNLTGYSPAFKDGYIDGCETAKGTESNLLEIRLINIVVLYVLENGFEDPDLCTGIVDRLLSSCPRAEHTADHRI